MKRAIILGRDKETEKNTLLLSRAKSLFDSLEPHHNNGQVLLKRVVSHLSECHEQSAVDVLREKNPEGDFQKITYEEVIQLCQRFGLSVTSSSSQNKRKHGQNHKHDGGISHSNPPQMTFAFAGNQTIVYSCGNQMSFVTASKQYDELDTLRILCENGYGLDPLKNAKLMLAKKNNISFRRVSPDLWQWVSMMKDQHLQKVNQSQQSTKSMATAHTETELCNIQDILKNKITNQQKYPMYYHRIIESKERNQCLKILKWSPLPLNYINQDSVSDILQPYLNQLEAENQLFRASAIAAFHFDFAKALDLLNKSQPDEEQIHAVKLLKSILAALKIIQQNVQNDTFLKPRLENGQGNTKECSQEITVDDTSRAKNCNFLNVPGLTGSAVATAAQNISINFKNIQNSNLRLSLIQVQINFLASLLKESTFTHPYLNVLAVFLCSESGNEGHKELWEMAELEMFDRIALALRFADDDILNAFISNSIAQGITNGQLECLVLVDKNEQAIQILQAYIDATGDIQTTGLLSAYLLLLGYSGKEELLRWYKNYKNILNRVNIFDKRNFLDKEFKNLSTQFGVKIDQQQDFSNKVKHHSIDSRQNCPSCCDFNTQFKAITKSQVSRNNHNSSNTNALVPKFANINSNNNHNNNDLTLDLSLNSAAIGVCNNCAQFLPTCCVCLLSCELPNPYLLLTSRARQITATSSQSSQAQAENLNLEDGILWCQSCGHGGHYKHILEWFNDYELCSVSDCSCKCSVI